MVETRSARAVEIRDPGSRPLDEAKFSSWVFPDLNFDLRPETTEKVGYLCA